LIYRTRKLVVVQHECPVNVISSHGIEFESGESAQQPHGWIQLGYPVEKRTLVASA
jgi:hypothetical protein